MIILLIDDNIYDIIFINKWDRLQRKVHEWKFDKREKVSFELLFIGIVIFM